MFYCREKELEKMNQWYESDAFECIIVYGRRRVGKTALINAFCQDKPVIYFSALQATANKNLSALSQAIHVCKEPEADTFPLYQSFDDALREISRLSRDRRLIFVIDEYPYLAKAEEAISSLLQHTIDHDWGGTKLYLILCGSSMSFMEKQVLGEASPLYGRRTGQLRLEPLTYRETALFCPNLSPEQSALVYGITGGIPHYINKLNVRDSVDEALMENLFDRASYLYEEPENLLKQELREPALYSDILSAIAEGASKISEIASQCKIDAAVCAKYLTVLIELGIVKKERPLAKATSKKTIYSIGDSFFRFWYRFVPKHTALIASGRIRQVYGKVIKPYLPEFMGLVFERMCHDYLLYYANNASYELLSLGRWWGNDPSEKKEIEIDIVGEILEASGETSYLIGSCKYRNTKTGRDELDRLRHYATVFAGGKNCRYVIFSKAGFTQGLRASSQAGEVVLATLEDMMGAGACRPGEPVK
ncbi:MAG: ATP-binding protein [Schwartzia sp.]|nr:ATP-binding protein [Schwartzia sp. (in: firmicutes)]